ncbi:DUF3995 domain-containing protein [Geothrix fuzhouensis]|uniref:DUF3995 domain-containing protein n=1 Tax=Geothrix fuzhouensis TaxID=2966451 RepID=UPI002147B678|nr:DUF3995 domain-containing protein [Geothrix fuzhouensis]
MLPVFLASTLLCLAGLHIYWAAGGPWGKRNVIPEVDGKPAFEPSRLITVAVALALTVAACVALLHGSILLSFSLASPIHWGTIAIGFVFLLRSIGEFRLIGFFKRLRGTTFATWDTWLFSPLCLVIAISFFLIAAS